MAKYGAGCSVWLDLVDASQFFNEAGLELAVGTADTSTFQPGVSPAWKAFIEGIAESKATVKGFYDQVNDAALFGEIRNGGSVLTYGPQGMVAVGDPARLVSVHATTVAESSPIGGAVLANVAYQGEGVVGFGQGWSCGQRCLRHVRVDPGPALPDLPVPAEPTHPQAQPLRRGFQRGAT